MSWAVENTWGEFRGHNKRFWMPVHLTLPARRDKMVEMVETMLKLHKDLPKAKTPHVRADGLRLTAYGPDGMTSVSLKVPPTADGL